MSGIFGVVSNSNCLDGLFYGVDYHSHLGTEFGGIAVFNGELSRQIHNISHAQFKSRFSDDASRMKGNKGIGVISDYDEQPIYLNSPLGQFSIVTAGFIENSEKLSVTTLRYQTIDDMIEAVGLSKEKLCLHCWMGQGDAGCCNNSCCTNAKEKRF